MKVWIYVMAFALINLLLAAVSTAGSTTYIYDHLDRLIEVQFSDDGKSLVYEYDKIGNLLSKTMQATSTGTVTGPVVVTGNCENNLCKFVLDPGIGGAMYASATDPNNPGATLTYYAINMREIPVPYGTGVSIETIPTTGMDFNSAWLDGQPITNFSTLKMLTINNITSNRSLSVRFKNCQVYSAINYRTRKSYNSLQQAYNEAITGDYIQAQATTFIENLNFDRGIDITIDGGYYCTFTPPAMNNSTLKGVINIGTPEGSASGGAVQLLNFMILPW